MRVWIASFALLFGLAQLYQWVKGFNLPLPVYILGGAFLAIASNYEKGIGAFFGIAPTIHDGELEEELPASHPPVANNQGQIQAKQSISFTIERRD